MPEFLAENRAGRFVYIGVSNALAEVAKKSSIPARDADILSQNSGLLENWQYLLGNTYRSDLQALVAGTPTLHNIKESTDDPSLGALKALYRVGFGSDSGLSHRSNPILTEEHTDKGERTSSPQVVTSETAGHILTELGIISPGEITDASIKDKLLKRAANVTESRDSLDRFLDGGVKRMANPQTGESVDIMSNPGNKDMVLDLKNPKLLGPLVSIRVGLSIVGSHFESIMVGMHIDEVNFNKPEDVRAFRRLALIGVNTSHQS